MIKFELNGKETIYTGDENLSLLKYLREIKGITSPKDGCSGQGACGACLLELNGKPALSCLIKMKKIQNAKVGTIEGFPPRIRRILGRAFVKTGAIQCGFCTPGFLSASKILIENNPDPTKNEIIKGLGLNLCRCTGYLKIISAIQLASKALREKKDIPLENHLKIGDRHPKYNGYDLAIGKSLFIDDIKDEKMLVGALKFSDHPRAKVLKIDCREAEKLEGVEKIFTGQDILGKRHAGIIEKDWPLMILEGETTRYIGDVLAGVVANTEETARKAVELIKVEYHVLEPLVDMNDAETSDINIHKQGNLLKKFVIKRGLDIGTVLDKSVFVVEAEYNTGPVDHAFLETEAAIARPLGEDRIEVLVQSQGVYQDRAQIADILGISENRVEVVLERTGGAFGGKEDLTVQGHAALYSFILKKAVKIKLSRPESIRMHPKRHRMRLKYRLGCDAKGRLTGLQAKILGDTGAYASVGAQVMQRAACHATGGYCVPNVDITAKAVYTNNIPAGAMRGFGVNQATFAIECAIDELCEKGNFDKWQFRYDNALTKGSMTGSGQILKESVGLKKTLLAVKEDFYKAKYAGLGCGIKNVGIGGGGFLDQCIVKIQITDKGRVILHHGWTEMGQGINTVAVQFLCHETGIDDSSIIDVKVKTKYNAIAGVTTASRGTSILGNAIINAAKGLKKDLKTKKLKDLAGRIYQGRWVCDWTEPFNKKGAVLHYSYSFATHLVILNEKGKVEKIVAAHDSGKVVNQTFFEGQVHGGVIMGLGYALSEKLIMEKGYLKETRLSKLGIPRIKDIPEIVVKAVEARDPVGPHGAKGLGEIVTVPTAGAVANALYRFDGVRRYELPLK